MNNNKMTIKKNRVFKLKPHWENYGLSHGKNNCSWFLPHYYKALFEGSVEDCLAFISNQGAEFLNV